MVAGPGRLPTGRLVMLLSAVALAACGAGSASRDRHDPQPAPPADSAGDALLRQVLAERIAAGDIPDFGLVRRQRPILVQLYSGSPAALPTIPGTKLSLISPSEAEERARRTGKAVPYIIAGAPQIRGDTAELMLGVDVTLPPGAGLKLCCCHAQVRYVRTGGRWRYLDMPIGICS